MRTNRLCLLAVLVCVAGIVGAKEPANRSGRTVKSTKAEYRAVCANSESQIDQEINNVRARLLGGGDCWWDFANGRYIVPKVDPASGQDEVSSIYAGSVWLGGLDPAGNLKLACQDYRNDGRNDFWPGPLRDDGPNVGTTDASICENWDRHFRVTGEEIRLHLRNLREGNLSESAIPRGVRGWPAQGNAYFADVWGFDLPLTQAGLAGFYDVDGDDIYDPLKGDYPSIEIRGCPLDRYPDEMIFWIYNDEGGGQPHARTQGEAIQMEVQVQAFGYVTSDELNDMTFQRYKLINRAVEDIDSCFFAMWTDPDLGCSSDDYIGCDTAKSLMYVYNQDGEDGQPGSTCDGVPTYGTQVPILGIDYFRGPLRQIDDTTFVEIGMSSFTYYNNGSIGSPLAGTTDPAQPSQYYNYITGTWRDGSPYFSSGSGYQTAGQVVDYAFPDNPDRANGWSMCTANLPFSDRRTIQASGPFKLKPGAVNELIIGIPWVPNIDYPCPDLEPLFRADKLAQGLFDNCFDKLDGPAAPDVDWIELDRQVIAVLTNTPNWNNFGETYREVDFLAPDSLRNSDDPEVKAKAEYVFQGYLVYQLLNPNVSAKDYTNPEQARLVRQVDLKDNVQNVFNWESTIDPNTGQPVYFPVLMVEGANEGIRHTFSITEDAFAAGNDKRLVNHKRYYYSVVAYAHNQYGAFKQAFDAQSGTNQVSGQQSPFLTGDLNIQIYTVIPRPIVDVALQASYGEGVEVTRLEGIGAGGNFLDLNQETRDRLLNLGPDSTLTYQVGRGPIDVTIFNPFEVKNGRYEIRFVDNDNNDMVVSPDARWELVNLDNSGQGPILSERTISQLNEQIVAQYGFSVTIAQTGDAGDMAMAGTGGGIGAEIEYAEPNVQWLAGFADSEVDNALFDFVQNDNPLDADATFDINRSLSTLGNGWFVPYPLVDWRAESGAEPDPNRMITPAWTQFQGLNKNAVATNDDARLALLNATPNVDIVLTSNKDNWSRCPIIESASVAYTHSATSYPKDPTLQTESPTPTTNSNTRKMFDTRYALSVSKDDNDGDGLPDPDNALDEMGQPLRGMGWFPGYAVDVETGRRLIVFFGENSAYHSGLSPLYTGRNMMWDPTNQVIRQPGADRPEDLPGGGLVFDYYDFILGGQHWVYVSNLNYTPENLEYLRKRFHPEANGSSAATAKILGVRTIAWTAMLQANTGFQMKSYRDGLIPTETRIKLRVENPYQTWYNESGERRGHPRYQFAFQDRQPQGLAGVQIENALDSVKAVPNPYYGFSQYETSQHTNTIKITNLPAKCTVTIYSLDGKFIRQYQRDEQYAPYQQITPDIEWDLKNAKGVPVASGVYLINLQAPGMGERTIKWFGIARQFDPAGF